MIKKKMGKILLQIAKKALVWGFRYLYNYIDKDHDGKLEKKEIEGFIAEMRSALTKLKRKI